MQTNNQPFPKQRLSFAEKIKDDYKWCKDVIDTILTNHSSYQFNMSNSDMSEYERMLSNYQLFNNILNQKDFERECNPFGIEIGQYKNPIQPYNKTPNKVQVLLGEEVMRPFSYQTILVNDDGIKSKINAQAEMLRSILMEELNSLIEQLSEDPEQQEELFQRIASPSDLEEMMSKNMLDARERLANQLLQYYTRQLDIPFKKNDAFKHGLISSLESVWVGVLNNSVTVEPLNSLGVIYDKSPDTKFIQDGLYAGYRTYMTVGEILDKFGEYLTDKQIEQLEGPTGGLFNADSDIIGKKMKYYNDDITDKYIRNNMTFDSALGNYGRASSNHFLVSHVEWKSQRRVAFLNYQNEFGDFVTDLVSEDFPLPDYAEKITVLKDYGKKEIQYHFDDMYLTYGWIPEVWQGVRIDDNIYCMMGPKKYQYRSLDNPHDVKLGYHGVVYNNTNAEPVSLMDRMKPFQYLYFIIVHKLKKLIARDRGKLFHFDTTMVPEELGLEKALYYMEEMDIDFYNPLQNAEQPGIHQRSKITTATDRSNMQHIMNYISLMEAIDHQMSDVAGITRQREGQVHASEAVTNMQQTIRQSNTITEAIYFQPHDRLWESILSSMIQCAQVLLKEKGTTKQYVLDDLSLHTLQITPDFFQNSDFGVFISNSSKDTELLQNLKQLSQVLLQTDRARISDIIKMYKATSIADLQSKIEQSEKDFDARQREQMEQQQEMQQQQIEAEMQEKEAQRLHERELQAQRDQAAFDREMLKIQGSAVESSIDAQKIEIEEEKLKLQEKLDNKQKAHEAKENEKDRQSAEKIASIRKPTQNKSNK